MPVVFGAALRQLDPHLPAHGACQALRRLKGDRGIVGIQQPIDLWTGSSRRTEPSRKLNDAFAFANRTQQFRACKRFEVTFVRVSAQAQS